MKRDGYCVMCGNLRPLRGGVCDSCRLAEARRMERAAFKGFKPERPQGGATDGGASR